MSALKEKQRAKRRLQIEDAANDLFISKGFSETTIEEISEQALVSPATVYNYYGTKGVLLLALVARGEAGIKEDMSTFLSRVEVCQPEDLLSEVIYSNIDDTLSTLSRDLWGQVVAFVATSTDPTVGVRYIQTISDNLGSALETVIAEMVTRGKLHKDLDAHHLAQTLTRLERVHFLNYIYIRNFTRDELQAAILADLSLIMSGLKNA
jgi:AcrR family transcriptional regulator